MAARHTKTKTLAALLSALALGASACGGSGSDGGEATDSESVVIGSDSSAGEAPSVDGDGGGEGDSDPAGDVVEEDGAADGDASNLSAYDQSVAAWDAAGFEVPTCLAGVYELGFGDPGFLSDDPAICQFAVLDYPGYDDPSPVADVIEAELAANGLSPERTEGEIEELPVIEVAATLDDGRRFVAVVSLSDTGLPEPELGGMVNLVPAG